MSTYSDATSDTNEESVGLTPVINVYFSPPLWEQRRTWALTQLRKHKAQTILDIGCGEGSLLSVLTNPSLVFPSNTGTEGESTLNVHATHIAGLELDTDTAKRAVEATKPEPAPADDVPAWQRPFPRWVNLDVDIWQGSLDILNGDHKEGWFGRKEWDVIVSTEVVEHLPKEILGRFLPVVLGVYRPKVLLLTTPNYNFNTLFSAPGVPREYGYPDPTGATDRVFRHDDHQREWTEEEWREWCKAAESEWAYDVELGGIGLAEEEDPYGREEAAGKASLTAIFRRRDSRAGSDEALQRRRDAAEAEARSRTTAAGNKQHRLLAHHEHLAHPKAGQPESAEAILDSLRAVLKWDGSLGSYEGVVCVDDVWRQDEVSVCCGGVMDALLQALDDADTSEWQIIRQPKDIYHWREDHWSWQIIWKDFVKGEARRDSPELSELGYYEDQQWDDEEYDGQKTPDTRETSPDGSRAGSNDCERNPWGQVPEAGWEGAFAGGDNGWGASATWEVEEASWTF